jgi:hypothetical protein
MTKTRKPRAKAPKAETAPQAKAEADWTGEAFRNNVAAGIDRLASLFRILEAGLLELPCTMPMGNNVAAGDLAVVARLGQEHAEALIDGLHAGESEP